MPADETIGRFVYDSDKIKAHRVYTGAFLPMHGEGGRLETSVCQLSLCTEDHAWYLGRTVVTSKSLKGIADLCVSIVLSNGLQCIASPKTGYSEHAVIIGWPADKQGQKSLAFKLAQDSRPRLTPVKPSAPV